MTTFRLFLDTQQDPIECEGHSLHFMTSEKARWMSARSDGSITVSMTTVNVVSRDRAGCIWLSDEPMTDDRTVILWQREEVRA